MPPSLSRALILALLCSLCAGCAAGEKSSAPYFTEPASQRYAPIYASDDMLGESEVVRTAVQSDAVAESTDGASPAPPTAEQRAEANSRAEAQKQARESAKRRLVRNAWMTVEVDDEDDFAPTLRRAAKLAESLGGYVQSETLQSMTLLVPTERLGEALAQVEKFGKVTRREVSVQDVTSSYVDLQIRIDNLRRMRARLTELVQQSTEVKDILEVERELGRVTTQLERLEGELRSMDKQTTYARLYLLLEEEVTPGPLGWLFYGIGVGIKWLFVWD
jgi:hypothetical protein